MSRSIHIQALTQYGIEKDTFLWDYDNENGYRYCTSLSNGFNRVYYIIEGNVEFKTKNEIKHVEQGKMYVFPADTDYTLIQKVFAPFRHVYFHVQLSSPVNELSSFEIEENSYVYNLLVFMRDCIDNTEPKYAMQLFELLLNKLMKNNNDEISEDRIYNAKRYLDLNLTSGEMNVSKITKIASLESKYFIKKFKKIYEKSPMQYYNDEKLKAAYSDLLDGLSPTEVTYKYHYNSLSNFSLKFKKKFGFAPSKCIRYNTEHKYLK
ncbi:MAG: helix-turn-helix domain-containing protein [Candidatus Scatosoma sp.]